MEHQHSHTETAAVKHRLARAIGHLSAVAKMVDEGRDCSDILIQLSAVRAEIQAVSKIILKDHIGHCLTEAIKKGNDETLLKLDTAIDRLL